MLILEKNENNITVVKKNELEIQQPMDLTIVQEGKMTVRQSMDIIIPDKKKES